MKTINSMIIALWMMALLSLSACDNFTEVDLPSSQLTGESVYQDVTTAKAALADIYARMRDGGVVSGAQFGGTPLMANYADDMAFYGGNPDIEQFNKHTLQPSNSFLAILWDRTYGELYAINALLDGVKKSTAITGEDKDRLIGEALFLRAYLNFYLVNLFGDIPYVISADYAINTTIGRTPQSEVWQNMLNDLIQAETLIPANYPTAERVRPNKATVTALLARVYLYMGNYYEAEAHATSVLSNPLYIWDTNPATAFLKESPAIIWSAQAGAAGLNTQDGRSYIFSFGPPSKPAMSDELRNAFEPGDLRRTNWVRAITDGTNFWYQAYKYKRNLSTTPSQEYTVLFGMSELYLIRAEARAMTGNTSGAQQDLNVIRSRAGLPDTEANTSETLMAAILRERRVELFTEQSHRWFDLKRTGNAAAALSALKPGWKSTDLLLPLPEKELLLNNNLLPQNPGY